MISEDNFVDFKCPHCGEIVSFPREDSTKLRACPNCLNDLIVPEPGAQVGRKLPLPIETAQLSLRRLVAEDWKDLLEFMPDEELFQYAGRSMQEAEILAWLEQDPKIRLTSAGQTFCLGIVLKQNKKMIGYLGLSLANTWEAMLQIWLSRSFQKQGFALEAVDAILGFCFEAIKLHRVTAMCDSRNKVAQNLYARVGMRREAEFIKDTPDINGWLSSVWFAALEEEYLAPASGTPEST